MPLSDRRALWIAMAAACSRGVLGLIFFMAGVYKVFTLSPTGHVEQYFLPFRGTFLPSWSLWAIGFTIPFVELAAGGLVVLGWFRTAAYAALGGVLVVVTFGHLLHNPLYPFHEHVIPRLALLLILLLLSPGADYFSLDELLERRRTRT